MTVCQLNKAYLPNIPAGNNIIMPRILHTEKCHFGDNLSFKSAFIIKSKTATPEAVSVCKRNPQISNITTPPYYQEFVVDFQFPPVKCVLPLKMLLLIHL